MLKFIQSIISYDFEKQHFTVQTCKMQGVMLPRECVALEGIDVSAALLLQLLHR